MGIFSFIKGIVGNPNKKNVQQYYQDTLSASSGTTFFASESQIIKIPELVSAIDMIANDIASAKFYNTDITLDEESNIIYNKKKQNDKWSLLLNKRPNDFQSSYEFWKSNIFNFFIRGSFFIWIYKDENGRPKELIPIHPNSISKVKDEDGNFAYELTFFESETIYSESSKELIPYDDIISVYAFDLENISDLSFRTIYSSLMEQLGLKNNYDLSQLNTSARILAHVKVPDDLNQEQADSIKNNMREFFTKAKDINSSAVLVTDPKMEVNLLGSEKTQIKSALDPVFVKAIMVKLANAFHIPLPKLNIVDTGQSFYKSREGINIDYINDTISPILEKIVSKMNAVVHKNATGKEFIFDIKKLFSIDHATRAEYVAKMRQNGILTTNELRDLSGYEPIHDGNKILGNGTLMPVLESQNTNDSSKDEGTKQNEKEVENE